MSCLKFSNVHVLHLKGSREERAQQHGEFLATLSATERDELAFTPLSQKNQALIARAARKAPVIGNLTRGFYEAFVLDRYLRLPRTYRKRLEPLIRSSNLPKKRIWLSLFQPDMLMVLAAKAKGRARAAFASGLPGCSSVVNAESEGGYFIRNLDYPAASFWEKHTAVFYHEPTEPDFQKFVAISSLGIHTPGLTGVNESGIAFSLHAHFSKEVSMKGVPIFFLGEDILEQARTMSDALALCRSFKTMGCWALNILSFKEQKAVSVELNGGKISVREPQTLCSIAHSNTFQTNHFRNQDLYFSGSFFEDCESRKKMLETLSAQLKPDASWADRLSLLSSHVDPNTNQVRIFGNTPSVITTIQSVGIDFNQQTLYVSARGESPTSHGPYLKLPLSWSDLNPNEEPAHLTLNSPHSASFMEALHLYHQAYVSWQVRSENPSVAHAYLIQACEKYSQDPHLQMQRGYFELIDGQAAAALECFESALKDELSSHLYQVALYFKGASLDILGQREEAMKCYSMILKFKEIDLKLKKKAENRLNRPYTESFCKRIEPDLQFAEPIDYV